MLDMFFKCTCGHTRYMFSSAERVDVSVSYLREVSYESCDSCHAYNTNQLIIQEIKRPLDTTTKSDLLKGELKWTDLKTP